MGFLNPKNIGTEAFLKLAILRGFFATREYVVGACGPKLEASHSEYRFEDLYNQ